MEVKQKRGAIMETPQRKKTLLMSFFSSFFRTTNNPPVIIAKNLHSPKSPISELENLVKMGEARQILKASAPTVRKYARMGCYKEYRFGAKLVFYDKQEILNFILNQGTSNGKR